MNLLHSALQFQLLLSSILAPLASAGVPFLKSDHITFFNSTISTGPSKVQFLYEGSGFDGPKLNSVNASVYDWWYFQAMAKPFSTFVIVFFTSTANAFPFLLDEDNVLPVWIWATFDNGTVVSMQTHAQKATIITRGDGSSGKYEPIGMRWLGSKGMSRYFITVDNKELGVKGTFKISLGNNPVLPCGPPKLTKSFELLPTVGWANAVPYGLGDVDMDIYGSKLRFSGLAYHDKNWGSAPLPDIVQTWYWGQATIGNHVLIWFDVVTPPKPTIIEYKRIHVFDKQSHRILYSSCADDAVTARPYDKDGNPLRFPPKLGDPLPNTMRIVAAGARVNVTVTAGKMIGGNGKSYTRWFGGVEGCVYGDCLAKDGMGIMEQMVLPG